MGERIAPPGLVPLPFPLPWAVSDQLWSALELRSAPEDPVWSAPKGVEWSAPVASFQVSGAVVI